MSLSVQFQSYPDTKTLVEMQKFAIFLWILVQSEEKGMWLEHLIFNLNLNQSAASKKMKTLTFYSPDQWTYS